MSVLLARPRNVTFYKLRDRYCSDILFRYWTPLSSIISLLVRSIRCYSEAFVAVYVGSFCSRLISSYLLLTWSIGSESGSCCDSGTSLMLCNFSLINSLATSMSRIELLLAADYCSDLMMLDADFSPSSSRFSYVAINSSIVEKIYSYACAVCS